jgi:hypothetical protein
MPSEEQNERAFTISTKPAVTSSRELPFYKESEAGGGMEGEWNRSKCQLTIDYFTLYGYQLGHLTLNLSAAETSLSGFIGRVYYILSGKTGL